MIQNIVHYRLSEIADITKLAGFEFTKFFNYTSDGEIIAIRALNIKNGHLVLNDIKKINRSVSEALPRSKLYRDDIVLSYTGTIGEAAQIKEDGQFHLAPNVAKVSPKSDLINPQYLFWYIRSLDFQQQMLNYAHGSTQKTVPMKVIRQLTVPVCERYMQDKIAHLLTILENKIELNNKINDNLQQQAQTLFKSWFVDFEPFGGKKPAGWSNAPLGNYIEIKRGGSPRPIQEYLVDDGLRWLKISDVTSLSSPFVLTIKEHIKEEGLRKTVFLKSGSLVLSNSATPGIPKILDVDSCIHDGWLYFPKSDFSKYYLYLLFNHIRKELVSLGNGSVFTNLKTDILKNFIVTRPDTAILNKFDDILAPIFETILTLDRENLRLSQIRDNLLPKLMSGEIDVSDIYI